MRSRSVTSGILGCALLLVAWESRSALPEDGGTPAPANVARLEKVKRFYGKVGYAERVRSDVRARISKMVGGDAGKVEEALARVKWAPIDDFLIREIDKWVDEKSLDELLPFLETPDGQKALALLKLDRGLLSVQLALPTGVSERTVEKVAKGYEECLDKALPALAPGGKGPQNEKLALAALRNLGSCEELISGSGKIDCDHDGLGEFGTILEMVGAVGVRDGYHPGGEGEVGWCDFSKKGPPLNPSVLSNKFAGVDKDGIVVKDGYCFRVFLPDSRFGFVHETGPASSVGLAGGTGRVGETLGEVMWCAYAWPENRGVTGTLVFFINQAGGVLQSSNEVAKWSGVQKAPAGESAFTGREFRSDVAVGVKGTDGDVWRPAK